MAPTCNYDCSCIQERRHERRNEHSEGYKNKDSPHGLELIFSSKPRNAEGAKQCFGRIADKPAQSCPHRNTGLHLCEEVSTQNRQEKRPPDAPGSQKKSCQKNCVGGPKSRIRLPAWSHQKTNSRPCIVANGDG